MVVIEFPDGLHEYVTTPVKRVLKLCDRAANVDDYGRGRPGYVPAYSGKALSLYEAVDARGDEIRAAFGAALAERAAAESVRLRALAATD